MFWRFMADVTVIAHLAFVVFVMLGGILVWFHRRLVWLHLPAAIWGFSIEVWGFICPLTHLENRWRRWAGDAGYEGGFVEHYLAPVLYPAGLDRETQWLLAGLVLVTNGVLYGVMGRRALGRRNRRAEPPAGG